MSILEKDNYLKREDDMEYGGATTKEYHYQHTPRCKEKPGHHIFSHQVSTASRQVKIERQVLSHKSTSSTESHSRSDSGSINLE